MSGELERYRDEAEQRLREAWTQGRIDASEHERRTTALRHTTSTDEIAAVERGDLRSQGGGLDTGGLSPIPGLEQQPVTASGGSSIAPVEPQGRGLSPQVADAIGNATPILATIGFFACGFALQGWGWAWLWWMLIPLVHTLLPAFTRGGATPEQLEHQRRRELKRERRELRRDQFAAGRERRLDRHAQARELRRDRHAEMRELRRAQRRELPPGRN